MEQITAITKAVAAHEKRIFAECKAVTIGDWLEEQGWRWLGGRWANLKFPSACSTYDTRAAVRLELLWQFCQVFKVQWSQTMAKAIIDGSNRRGK